MKPHSRWPSLDCFQVRFFLINAKGLSWKWWALGHQLYGSKMHRSRHPCHYVCCIVQMIANFIYYQPPVWGEFLWVILLWEKKCRLQHPEGMSFEKVSRFLLAVWMWCHQVHHQHFPILPSICSSWVRIYPLPISRNSFKRQKQIGSTSVFNPKSMLISSLL